MHGPASMQIMGSQLPGCGPEEVSWHHVGVGAELVMEGGRLVRPAQVAHSRLCRCRPSIALGG